MSSWYYKLHLQDSGLGLRLLWPRAGRRRWGCSGPRSVAVARLLGLRLLGQLKPAQGFSGCEVEGGSGLWL